MKKKKLNPKQEFITYLLKTDEELNANKKITNKDIKRLFKVSESTISQTVKEMRYKVEINKLQKELSKVKSLDKKG